MLKIVVFHHIAESREAAAHALRAAGHDVTVATQPDAAWQAVQRIHPDVVITNFPAFLEGAGHGAPTLTEAIRHSPDFADVPILSFRSYSEPLLAEYAAAAGVTESARIPEIPQRFVEIVHRITGSRDA